MPRMKNATKPSKSSSHKKISISHSIHKSPDNAVKLTSPPVVESVTAVQKKQRGNPTEHLQDESSPVTSSHKEEKSSKAGPSLATGKPYNQGKEAEFIGLKIKKEKIAEYFVHNSGKKKKERDKNYENSNGSLDKSLKSANSNSSHKPSLPSARLTIHTTTKSSNKKPVFSPPSQSRFNRIITPSKRLKDKIIDKADTLATKVRKVELNKASSSENVETSKTKTVLNTSTGASSTVAAGVEMASKNVSVDSNNVTDLESRARRSRKPSQKLIELLELEKDGTPGAMSSPEKALTPVKSSTSSVIDVSFSSNLSSPALTLPEPNVTVDQFASPAEQHGEADLQCYLCKKIPTVALKHRFNHTYCNSCFHMWVKYLSKNIIPDCVADCSHDDISKCVGCKAVAMNSTISDSRKVELRATDKRHQYIQQLLSNVKISPTNDTASGSALTRSVEPAAKGVAAAVDSILPNSPSKVCNQKLLEQGVSPSSLLKPTTNLKEQKTKPVVKASSIQRITILNSPIKGKDAPSSWASQLQKTIQMPAKSIASSSISLLSPVKQPAGSNKLNLAYPQKRIVLGGSKLVNLTGRGGIVYKIQGSLANTALLGQAKPVSIKSAGLTPVQLLAKQSVVQSKPKDKKVKVIQGPVNLSAAAVTAPISEVLSTKKLVDSPLLADELPSSPMGSVKSESGYSESPVFNRNTRPDSVETVDSGPRVKHVSRSAHKAQGEPALIQPADFRLSALPPDEKCKIWNDKSLLEDYSDEEIDNSKAARLEYNWDADEGSSDDEFIPTVLQQKAHRMKIKTKFLQSNSTKMGRRRPRCGECAGCRAVNCKRCVYCMDMKKYGGPGKMKQCCLERQCVHKGNLRGGKTHPDGEDTPVHTPKTHQRKHLGGKVSIVAGKRSCKPPKRYRSPSQSSVGGESVDTQETEFTTDGQDILIESDLTNKPLTELLRASERLKQSEMGQASVTAQMEGEESFVEQSLMTADGTLISDQNPGFSLVEAYHRLMADFIDTYDIDKVWEQGVAIVTSFPQSTRVLCYLCGSGGLHSLCYCSVCCEPFHNFCLEERDRPKSTDSRDWLCRKCRFCQVCGRLDNLLTCDRCTKTYHAQCLGDGYTIEPTSAGVWVCNSCVKCTSCGATTPGGPNDKWNSDFSLCATCEALKLKGNFCPICTLCYSDDDWDCKMIGCSTCESWTHSKCENLPDDLYELIGYIGDDEAQYVCRTCIKASKKDVPAKPDWLVALENLRVKGFSIICTSILDKKYSQSVAKVDEEELRTFYDQHKQELIAYQEKRARSQSPVKSRSRDKSHSPDKSLPLAKEAATEPVVVSPVVSPPAVDAGKEEVSAAKDDKMETDELKITPIVGGVKELCLQLTDCINVPSQPPAEPAEKPVRRPGRPRKKPLPPPDEKEKKPKRKPGRPCRSQSAAENTDDGSPLKSPQRQFQSPEASTPAGMAGKEKPAATPDSTPRRSGREKKAKKEIDKKVSSTPKEVHNSHEVSQDMDISSHDISSSSLPEGGVYSLDLAELGIRFKGVEWETPPVTFESLKGSGHPLDIIGIQENAQNYTSINDFIDDVVRVLQGAITRSHILGTKALKQVLATKKLFEQEVAQLFPWVEVKMSALWEYNLSMPKGMLDQARLPPSSEHTYALWLRKPSPPTEEIIQPSPYKLTLPPSVVDEALRAVVPFNLHSESDVTQALMNAVDLSGLVVPQSMLDTRKCQFCSLTGDDNTSDKGRLLYCGADDWVHVNCAIWSAEVFEEEDGTLQRVHTAVARGKMLDCSLCSNRGATVGCCAKGCTENFHFMCAREAKCTFMEDKQVFCVKCEKYIDGGAVQTNFAVLRTVTVDFAHAKIKKPWQRGFKPTDITIIAGSLTVENLGYVLPESDYLNLLVPIDFCVSRVYWSTTTPYKRSVYTCKVVKVDTVVNAESTDVVIPDTTICHDCNLPGYTPFAVLTKKYPNIFAEDNIEVLRNAATADYVEQVTECMLTDPLSKSWPSYTSATTSQALDSSWPSLSGVSERTKRLLGYVSPRKLVSPGYSESNSCDEDDLPNLTGIASALNKAAHRSQKKRRRKDRRKAAILYGSSAPEVSGNIDDDVAEILDMVTEEHKEAIDEREVIILRDVDDNVAQEVVEVIGQMSKEEADERGGVQVVMQSILDKHRREENKVCPTGDPSLKKKVCGDNVTSLNKEARKVCEDNDQSPIDKMELSKSDIAGESNSATGHRSTVAGNREELSEKSMEVDETSDSESLTKQTEGEVEKRHSDDDGESHMDTEPPMVDCRPPSATSVVSNVSSLQAYSSGSSADNSLNCTDIEDNVEQSNDIVTSATPLRSPPKIVITDFSFDEPTDVAVDDPFAGVTQSSSGVSHGTKDRLKCLVRKRSESLNEASVPKSEEEESKAVKRRASLGDLLSVQAIKAPHPMLNIHPSKVATDTHSGSSVPSTSKPPSIGSVPRDSLGTIDEHCEVTPQSPLPQPPQPPQLSHPSQPLPFVVSDDTPDQSLKEVGPGINKTESSGNEAAFISSKSDSTKRANRETVAVKKKRRLGPKSMLLKLNRQSAVDFDSDRMLTELDDNLMDVILPSPPPSPMDKESQAISLPGKFMFMNNFYEGGDDWNSLADSCIVTRDRTPVVSCSERESECSSDSEAEDVERIVAPPYVNCIVRDTTVTEILPNILNAKVMVAKLPADSESEGEMDADTTASAPEPFYREPSPPARDISRDVRKDMINYCEDEESSSTDEEEICKPKVSLRQREKVNYNENALAAADQSDTPTTPAVKERKKQVKPRPMTGKVLVDKDGSIKSRTENIPSELQKTISDAIRKARNKEAPPSILSSNQGYSGAAHTGKYGLKDRGSYGPAILANRSKPADQIMPVRRLKGDKCQLAMMSQSTRKAVLPQPASEEEIIGQRTSDDLTVANQIKPSSTFLAFEISSDEGFKVRADNWDDAWRNVTDAVRELRMSSGCPAISYAGVNGLHMFGLQHTSVTYFTEQLYGSRYCHNYRFTFHKPPLFEYEEELPESSTGCCRSEGYSGRKPTDMFSFVDSRYRKRPVGVLSCISSERDESLTQKSARRATSLDLPMAMRFRHLKTNAKQAAAVYRSSIHGRGLVCKRTIEPNEMIIEYAGEVIRQGLCDKREKYYDNKGIGCYMFRIDDHYVVDATMKGNAARFINHSCDPNCFSKVVDVNGSKHILIFALRTIQRGEELTYDYKFPFEEVKIPCTCGAKRCRGFLN